MPTKKRHNAGFTLAELLVATTLTVLVMGGVYVAFSSSIRLWRLGEANLRTYQ
ncbi:MAG: prepilin-type N-terminal cleavage/methylation domain-containing protein, partial [bacterium]|nr:prepilin-type N-terminal cleavage/methylation domain-containing protein [bacterium]